MHDTLRIAPGAYETLWMTLARAHIEGARTFLSFAMAQRPDRIHLLQVLVEPSHPEAIVETLRSRREEIVTRAPEWNTTPEQAAATIDSAIRHFEVKWPHMDRRQRGFILEQCRRLVETEFSAS